ncbi:MAG: hypothetical protein WAO90_08195, partial [Mycobacterium sp.]
GETVAAGLGCVTEVRAWLMVDRPAAAGTFADGRDGDVCAEPDSPDAELSAGCAKAGASATA